MIGGLGLGLGLAVKACNVHKFTNMIKSNYNFCHNCYIKYIYILNLCIYILTRNTTIVYGWATELVMSIKLVRFFSHIVFQGQHFAGKENDFKIFYS